MGLIVLVFMLMLFFNMPVAFSLTAAVLVYILLSDLPLTLMVQQMFSGINNFVFLAVPFFILSGLIMERGGISDRLIRFSSILVDRVTGGFAMSASLASMFFAAISGSGPATTAAIGGTMLPAMERKGYGKEWSVAYLACSGTMGPIIPPSITMVIFGAMAGASIGALFVAGFLPGLLVGLILMFFAYIRAKKAGIPREANRFSWREFFIAFKDAFWAFLMPLIIIGGILGGIFTPTEAAVVAVVYTLIVALFIYRSITWKDLPGIFKETAITSGVIMILTANASAFAWILSAEQGPQQMLSLIQSITDDKLFVLFLINVFLIIIGMFLDTTSALIISVPTLLIIGNSIGVDPLHMGLIVTTNLSIGMATPPVGYTLFTACSIGKVSITQAVRPILPMLGGLFLVVFLVTYFPDLFLWVPELFIK